MNVNIYYVAQSGLSLGFYPVVRNVPRTLSPTGADSQTTFLMRGEKTARSS